MTVEPVGSTEFDSQGRLAGARQLPSPNCDERPDAMPVSLLVIHNICLPPNEFGGTAVIELFQNRLDPQSMHLTPRPTLIHFPLP